MEKAENIVTDGEHTPTTSQAVARRGWKRKTELESLISAIFGPTSLENGSTYSGGVRRSVRIWCHTQGILPMQRPKNKPTLKSIGKKKSAAATKKIINPLSHHNFESVTSEGQTNRNNTSNRLRNWLLSVSNVQLLDRGPVCSSTPRNPDITVEPFPDSAFPGQRSAISSEEPFAETDAAGQTNRNNESNRVMNWQQDVSNVQPSERNNQREEASFLEDMSFCELDGIECAFYDTKDTSAVGYMRFKSHQVLNEQEVKACPLKFIVQIGEFAVQYGPIDGEDDESCILHEGDMVEVDKGSRYSIQNILDAVGVLLVIRG